MGIYINVVQENVSEII